MKNNWIFALLTIAFFCNQCNRKTGSDTSENSAKDKSIPELPRFQKKISDVDTLALNTDTLLYYQKSACFGFCPTYNFIVYQNGMIKYNGVQHIEPLGSRYDLISENWWKEVALQIQKINFFELANVYPLDEKMYIPDLPNTIIIVKDLGKRKSITDNHDAPKALKDFEFFLEAKFNEFHFIKEK